MSNNEWKYRLRESLEDYTEAAPEGLWDAVRTGVSAKKRRRVIAWWSSAVGMSAAAAIVAGVFLFRDKSSENIDVLVPDSSVVAEAQVQQEDTLVHIVDLSRPEDINLTAYVPVKETVKKADTVPFTVTVPEVDIIPVVIDIEPVDIIVEPADIIVEPADIHIEDDIKVTEEKPARKEREIKEYDGDLIAFGYSARKKPAVRVSGNMGASQTISSGSSYGMGTKGLYYASPTNSIENNYFFDVTRNQQTETKTNHTKSPSLSAIISFPIASGWSVGTGIVYSRLKNETVSERSIMKARQELSMDYIGIPVYAEYDLFTWKRLSLYADAGPMFEFCTNARTKHTAITGDKITDKTEEKASVKDNRWSVNANIGIQARITRHSYLFVEPGFSYHFSNGSKVENYYTDKPAAFNLNIGYRFMIR